MHHAHSAWVGFLRQETVLHKFLGEEDHVIHSSIEKASKSLAKWVLCLDDWLVMPHDNRVTIKSQSPKQDDGFDAKCMRGVKNIVSFATSKHFPSCDYHVSKPLVSVYLMMPHHIYSVVLQLQSSIKKVRGEHAFLPFTNDSLCVLCMIEIYCHFISSTFHSAKAHVPRKERQRSIG